MAINCAAIPENLIEAELFGYVPGAFTGARKQGSPGRLREAHGGTLFLDEIGDMPLALQTRLLRVLQERSVTPVGGSQAVPVDFALVSATHCQLMQAAELGRFRQDLYYRLNGLTVQLPALRERSDFLPLTQRLLADLTAEQALPQPAQLAPELFAPLAAYPWPGNLRQYASALRTACALLAEGEDTITWSHLPDDLQHALHAAQTAPIAPSAGHGHQEAARSELPVAHPPTTLPGVVVLHAAGGAGASAVSPLNLQQLSRTAIDQAVQAAGGNMSQAARTLGISRQTLYRKLAARQDAAHP